ncbi:hypothetical protein [Ancylomarina longa]|uniref:hypothetical protein n=1 Tax=Ancylomarina longa TaxID=2487017 RepID=UPI001ADEA1DE|nr:hypothetical protein [Ancylomarina longa]
MKNLEEFGVQKMNAQELKITDGGGVLEWIIGGLAYELLADGPEQCGKDFMSGFGDA